MFGANYERLRQFYPKKKVYRNKKKYKKKEKSEAAPDKFFACENVYCPFSINDN